MSDLATQTVSSLPFIKLETQEIDELAYYIKHADVELIQTSRSQSPSSLTLVSFDNIDLQVGQYGAASISNATIDKDKSGVVFKMNAGLLYPPYHKHSQQPS